MYLMLIVHEVLNSRHMQNIATQRLLIDVTIFKAIVTLYNVSKVLNDQVVYFLQYRDSSEVLVVHFVLK